MAGHLVEAPAPGIRHREVLRALHRAIEKIESGTVGEALGFDLVVQGTQAHERLKFREHSFNYLIQIGLLQVQKTDVERELWD